MGLSAEDPLFAEAIAWRIRLRDDAVDWPAFVAWLEGDPARSAAYDAVALADEDLDLAGAARPPLEAANDDSAGRGAFLARYGWLGAVAAMLIAALFLWPQLTTDQSYSIATAAGVKRIVTLDAGTRIALNGGSRLLLDHGNPRYARLESGEAMFDVRHDESAPFELEAGDARIRDIGTRFNVVRAERSLRLEVAEGVVLYNPDREAIRLSAGETLSDADGPEPIMTGRRPPEAIGGWRKGQLSYEDTRLPIVAGDLARSLGVPVAVDRSIADRSFTGTIHVEHDQRRLFSRLEPLLGVRARPLGKGWKLEPASHAAP